MLTTFDADDIVMRAIGAGAAGFLLKTSSAPDIMAPNRPDTAISEPVLPEMTSR